MMYEAKTFKYLACTKCNKNTIHNVLLDVDLNSGKTILKESECVQCGMDNATYMIFENKAKVLLPWLKDAQVAQV